MSDIAGSTRLWEEQRETMVVALAAHDVMLRLAVEEAGGTVFKTAGDGMLAAFDHAESAVTAAIEGQHALNRHDWPETGRLHVRMAIHSGGSSSARKTSALARRVAADLAALGWRLERVLTDNGSEFRSEEFGRMNGELGAHQSFIRPGRPATDGAVERVQRTILEECWRPSFARSLVPKIGGLVRDLAAYLVFYNEERAHTGRLTRGQTPLDALIGARKMRPR